MKGGFSAAWVPYVVGIAAIITLVVMLSFGLPYLLPIS